MVCMCSAQGRDRSTADSANDGGALSEQQRRSRRLRGKKAPDGVQLECEPHQQQSELTLARPSAPATAAEHRGKENTQPCGQQQQQERSRQRAVLVPREFDSDSEPPSSPEWDVVRGARLCSSIPVRGVWE
jgi:hypothetical protein